MSRGFRLGVLWPLRLAHSALGDSLWGPLETTAKALGVVSAVVARPLLQRRHPTASAPLQQMLAFTDWFESRLGIEAEDEIVDERTAKRTVTRCPFADMLEPIPEFCTRLGGGAGVTSCARLVPGAVFEVRSTKSSGASCCEYFYRLP